MRLSSFRDTPRTLWLGNTYKHSKIYLLEIYSCLICRVFVYLPTRNYRKHPNVCIPCPSTRYKNHQHYYHVIMIIHIICPLAKSASNDKNVPFPSRRANAGGSSSSRCGQHFVFFQGKSKTQLYPI